MSANIPAKTPASMELPTQVRVRPAASRAELEEAFRLVYRSYLSRGYAAPDPTEIRLSVHNVLPETLTFVGILRDDVIATVTLMPDSDLGLPMDGVYRKELDALRREGRRLCEVSMLADRRMEIKRTLPMLLSLMKLVFDYTTEVLHHTDLCITINPRHDAFYKRYLRFTDLAGERSYPNVQGHPALARRLDMLTARDLVKDIAFLRRAFFENRTPRSLFDRRYIMSCDDVDYFFVKLTRTLEEASHSAIAFLKTRRPDCPWNRWPKGLLSSRDEPL